MKKTSILLGIMIVVSSLLFGQSLETTYVSDLFRGTRVINGHSVETLQEGELELLISHRFGALSGGTYELFGLDQSEIRFGFDYGVKNWLMIGIGRSSLSKDYDAYVKVGLLRQSKGKKQIPISLSALGSVAINTLKQPSPEETILFQSRLSYVGQLQIARKFGDRLSLQLMPTLVHFNLVDSQAEKNDVLSLGAAGKYQLSKNLALTVEYYYNLPGQLATGKYNSMAIGVDINTGSHVFQIHLTNSNGMIEKAYIGETRDDWFRGDIHLGFNMSRTFKVKGRRY